MIFNRDFDRLLWLMAAGDEKNREKLAYFIRIIPQEVYEDINNAIISYDEVDGSFISSNISSCNSISVKKRLRTLDGIDYAYEFELDGCLHLKIWRWKGCHVEEKFELSLSANTCNILDNMRNFESIYVGSFCCNSKNFENGSKNSMVVQSNNEYYLVKTPIGYVVETLDRYDLKKKMIGYEKKCPGELYATDFCTSGSLNYLVKAKKRTNRNWNV